MKTKYIILGSLLTILLGIICSDIQYGYSATITPGYVFATNELVTAAKLTSLASGTISGISTADMADGSITTAKLGASSVTAAKIVAGTITTANIANRTILGVNIATNSITEIELSSNITFRVGTLTFQTNQIDGLVAVSGVTTSAGAGDSGKIPKLNANGKLDTTFSSTSTTATNLILANDFVVSSGGPYYTNVLSYTTTSGSNGVLYISAQMALKGNGDWLIGRLKAGPTIYVDNSSDAAALGTYAGSIGRYSLVVPLVSNITVNLQARNLAGAGGTVYANPTSSGTGNPVISNATYLTILEVKP